MTRKLKVLAFAAALTAAVSIAHAQDFVFGWNPRSGDVWIDQRLGDINDYGYRRREPFIDEMATHYGAPRTLVRELLIDRRWAPGDVYYACSIAHVLGIPCRNVVEVWERDHGQGWGAVAKRMGIKPGSAEFHRLKKGFVPTYDRWGRTVVLDADLRRDFPGRGKGAKSSGSQGQSGKASAAHGKKPAASHGKSKSDSGAEKKGSPGKSGDKGNGKNK